MLTIQVRPYLHARGLNALVCFFRPACDTTLFIVE